MRGSTARIGAALKDPKQPFQQAEIVPKYALDV
jgi:hypothetical protein